MALYRSTLFRILVVVLAVWLLLGVIGLVLFNVGGSVPGDGVGDLIEISKTP